MKFRVAKAVQTKTHLETCAYNQSDDEDVSGFGMTVNRYWKKI
jgi:hypothetical protein